MPFGDVLIGIFWAVWGRASTWGRGITYHDAAHILASMLGAGAAVLTVASTVFNESGAILAAAAAAAAAGLANLVSKYFGDPPPEAIGPPLKPGP